MYTAPSGTWQFSFQCFAGRNDGSPPRDWFPRLWGWYGRTQFSDEVSLLSSIRVGLLYGSSHIHDTMLYVGDPTVNQAVRCKVMTTLPNRNTALVKEPAKCVLRLEVEDILWTTAVEESTRTRTPLMDYKESLPVNINTQLEAL